MTHLVNVNLQVEAFDAMSYIGGVVAYFHILQWYFIAKTKYFFTV